MGENPQYRIVTVDGVYTLSAAGYRTTDEGELMLFDDGDEEPVAKFDGYLSVSRRSRVTYETVRD